MIEDIILENDRRGISELRKVLSPYFCKKASDFLYRHMESVLVVTGFYVSGSCETDGPVSSIMLGEALMQLNKKVVVVTDRYCYEVLKKVKVPFEVYSFPIAGEKESKKYAEELLSAIEPSLLISVERCGRAQNGLYYNMRGEDISDYTGKIDYFFESTRSIGIGDGGNEIGMGNVYNEVKKVVLHGEIIASVVRTNHLIISSVSNWGVYGLLGYLSQISGEILLKKEDRILKSVVRAGAVDSLCRKCTLMVDGYPLEETNRIIEKVLNEMPCER
ncbi:MAG: DUF4392 domain-containing protein [Theionarchaea archaeon]|nr:DUF4392 domain-containing protein [Theionarchaea archaeon]